eukprot:scaffold1313_cov250-Pinguiococcus_pyrenoidosus.AAC.15
MYASLARNSKERRPPCACPRPSRTTSSRPLPATPPASLPAGTPAHRPHPAHWRTKRGRWPSRPFPPASGAAGAVPAPSIPPATAEPDSAGSRASDCPSVVSRWTPACLKRLTRRRPSSIDSGWARRSATCFPVAAPRWPATAIRFGPAGWPSPPPRPPLEHPSHLAASPPWGKTPRAATGQPCCSRPSILPAVRPAVRRTAAHSKSEPPGARAAPAPAWEGGARACRRERLLRERRCQQRAHSSRSRSRRRIRRGLPRRVLRAAPLRRRWRSRWRVAGNTGRLRVRRRALRPLVRPARPASVVDEAHRRVCDGRLAGLGIVRPGLDELPGPLWQHASVGRLGDLLQLPLLLREVELSLPSRLPLLPLFALRKGLHAEAMAHDDLGLAQHGVVVGALLQVRRSASSDHFGHLGAGLEDAVLRQQRAHLFQLLGRLQGQLRLHRHEAAGGLLDDPIPGDFRPRDGLLGLLVEGHEGVVGLLVLGRVERDLRLHLPLLVHGVSHVQAIADDLVPPPLRLVQRPQRRVQLVLGLVPAGDLRLGLRRHGLPDGLQRRQHVLEHHGSHATTQDVVVEQPGRPEGAGHAPVRQLVGKPFRPDAFVLSVVERVELLGQVLPRAVELLAVHQELLDALRHVLHVPHQPREVIAKLLELRVRHGGHILRQLLAPPPAQAA